MKIQSVRILNFKGFRDSGRIGLAPHLNVLVGQNNSGKSALLQAFEIFHNRFDHVPHRNPDQAPGTGFPSTSEFQFQLTVSGEELLNFAYTRGTNLQVLLPQGAEQATQGTLDMFGESLFGVTGTARPRYDGWTKFNAQSETFRRPDNGRVALVASPNPGERDFRIRAANEGENLNTLVWEYLKTQVFTFNAERYKIGQCDAGQGRTLAADAHNLPICLQSLLRSRQRFNEFVSLVGRVLPQVYDVSAAPVADSGTQVEVVIYPTRTDRPELGIPLNSCGTGVAQVLAILYVVFTNQNAIIVIDEPNSFLHPGATKNLMHVIKGATAVQFIVSSHSADVVSSLAPNQMLQAVWSQERSMSEIVALDGRSLEAKRTVMSDLGISFSDLFGHEVVVWVEGQTEAKCFDLVIDRADSGRPPGLVFLSMPWASKADAKALSDGEFFEALSRVSEGAVLWPSDIRFSFDPEKRNADQLAEITRRARGKASFLPRRMYECYLLHPEAIAALLAEFDRGASYSGEQVVDWLNTNRETYVETRAAMPPSDGDLDAARMLAALIATLSEHRLTLDKVRHGTWLTSWLLDNEPDHLSELSAYVQRISSPSTALGQ